MFLFLKSVALHLIENLVGKEFVSALSYSQLNGSCPMAALIGKHVNITADTSGMANKNADTFNTLVEGGLMSTYLRGDDYYELSNMALFVFDCNTLSYGEDIFDEAFFSQIKPIPFYNKIPKDQQIENLDAKLFEEREYIVIQCINALKRLKNNKFCFSNEGEMDSFIYDYKTYVVDSFILFSEKYLQRSRKSKVACSDVETYYKKFCKLNELPENSFYPNLVQSGHI
jgi:phage/plasmid-associated DNA primase